MKLNGGVGPENAMELVKAGADVLVAGRLDFQIGRYFRCGEEIEVRIKNRTRMKLRMNETSDEDVLAD